MEFDDHLQREYAAQRTLFEGQPALTQRFLESQAQIIAATLIDNKPVIHFSLPDKVTARVKQLKQEAVITIPEKSRHQHLGGTWKQLTRQGVRSSLLTLLRSLEQSPDEAISTSASLIRYATATHLLHNLLPSGRSVTYKPKGDEHTPSIPQDDMAPESAITQAGDAIAEEGTAEEGRGELQTPFVPAARRFYLPQWVAFDDKNHLLCGSEKEANTFISSMQNYVQLLHRASSLAPYIVASEEYQRKRYGILGQLINQGRALAAFKTAGLITEIKERANRGTLNRGLRISMPYFDDQNLILNEVSFDVIPAGRIMFIPAFVVRATRQEAAKRAQDTRFNESTRRHLLFQLKTLEEAFQYSSL